MFKLLHMTVLCTTLHSLTSSLKNQNCLSRFELRVNLFYSWFHSFIVFYKVAYSTGKLLEKRVGIQSLEICIQHTNIKYLYSVCVTWTAKAAFIQVQYLTLRLKESKTSILCSAYLFDSAESSCLGSILTTKTTDLMSGSNTFSDRMLVKYLVPEVVHDFSDGLGLQSLSLLIYMTKSSYSKRKNTS